MGKIPSGCFIVTAGTGDDATGFLASWVQQVSFEPQMLMICIKRDRYIYDLIMRERTFSVNVLGDEATTFMRHFGRGFPPGDEAFSGIDVGRGQNRVPFLKRCLGHLECRVVESIAPGDHQVIIGEVTGGTYNNQEPHVHVRKNGRNY